MASSVTGAGLVIMSLKRGCWTKTERVMPIMLRADES